MSSTETTPSLSVSSAHLRHRQCRHSARGLGAAKRLACDSCAMTTSPEEPPKGSTDSITGLLVLTPGQPISESDMMDVLDDE